jgi:phenylalanyl-tRNA synthetase beta chain
MKVLLSWIREFVDVQEPAEAIGALMSVRGLALEGLEYRPAPSERGESKVDDAVMDFDVTANRPDCLSIVGIAREIATAYRLPLGHPAEAGHHKDEKSVEGSIPVAIEAPELCGRFVAAAASVTVGPSPKWMQERLTACGIRPISNIVDITNYVLLELGHPMHAFDRAKLAGGRIVVRRARKGESIKTLDGKVRPLTPDMVVVCDAERAQGVGGVMGGLESEVTEGTTQVVFEAAWFEPASVRATAKALGLKTEASARFERGMDRTAPHRAMQRALELLQQIGAGTAVGAMTDTYPNPWQPRTLRLARSHISGLLGMDVPDDAVRRILASLGCEVRELPNDRSWDVTSPPWRVDIQRPVDLIEEVGRHYGYEHLPSTFPGVQQAPRPSDARIARDRRVRTALLGMGFSEAITFAFIEAPAAEPYLLGQAPVAMANPLSEKFAVMRPSLIPGLVDALSHNRRHGRPDVRLFEIGNRFSPTGETRGAAFAWMGLGTADHWSGDRRAVDFSDIKGVVEQLASLAAVDITFAETRVRFFVEGRTAEIRVNGRAVGVMGQLSPAIAESRGLAREDETYVAEIDLDAVTAVSPVDTRRAKALPRHPFVVRDVSILVADTLSAETVRGTIRTAAPETLIQVREFDRYQGKGIPDGKVSLSYRLTFQSPDRTLTDEEVSAAMAAIVAALQLRHNAEQR